MTRALPGVHFQKMNSLLDFVDNGVESLGLYRMVQFIHALPPSVKHLRLSRKFYIRQG